MSDDPGSAGNTPGYKRLFIRVMIIQLVTLSILGFLQLTFGAS